MLHMCILCDPQVFYYTQNSVSVFLFSTSEQRPSFDNKANMETKVNLKMHQFKVEPKDDYHQGDTRGVMFPFAGASTWLISISAWFKWPHPNFPSELKDLLVKAKHLESN